MRTEAYNFINSLYPASIKLSGNRMYCRNSEKVLDSLTLGLKPITVALNTCSLCNQ